MMTIVISICFCVGRYSSAEVSIRRERGDGSEDQERSEESLAKSGDAESAAAALPELVGGKEEQVAYLTSRSRRERASDSHYDDAVAVASAA